MFYRKSEEKYWGIIRRPRDHPQHQATFATRNLLPQQVKHRRVGRPRAAWTYETMKDCWRRKFHNIPFQMQNREHREEIKTWALNREDPFWHSFFTYRTNSCCSGATGSHPDLWFKKNPQWSVHAILKNMVDLLKAGYGSSQNNFTINQCLSTQCETHDWCWRASSFVHYDGHLGPRIIWFPQSLIFGTRRC